MYLRFPASLGYETKRVVPTLNHDGAPSGAVQHRPGHFTETVLAATHEIQPARQESRRSGLLLDPHISLCLQIHQGHSSREIQLHIGLDCLQIYVMLESRLTADNKLHASSRKLVHQLHIRIRVTFVACAIGFVIHDQIDRGPVKDGHEMTMRRANMVVRERIDERSNRGQSWIHVVNLVCCGVQVKDDFVVQIWIRCLVSTRYVDHLSHFRYGRWLLAKKLELKSPG